MKLIEAMKGIKDLARKADDLKAKVKQYCADLDYETPTYEDQRAQVASWIQAHTDILREILRLRVAVQRTNLATSVTITLGGVAVTKTIAEWIHRRRDLAESDRAMWASLTDRNLREGLVQTSAGGQKEVKIRRYYDPKQRDEKIELYRSEPQVIDATLEVVNAVTDLRDDAAEAVA